MSTVTTICSGCGTELTLPVPDGDSGAARWLRRMAAKALCDECAERADADQAERERHQARDARRGRCQLPRPLRGELLEYFPVAPGQEAAHAAATDWAKTEDAGGLMLAGEVGIGKTRLAAAACWTRLERWSCTYVSIARAMARLGSAYTDEGRLEAVRVFAGSGPVVLDDFDKARPTEFGREQLFSAIDARDQAGAPMLVTTNLKLSEIGERFGEPLMSRLARCRVVRMEGGDRRLGGKGA